MRVRGKGYWEIFVPEANPATNTSTRSSARRSHAPVESDPLALAAELRPQMASNSREPRRDSASASCAAECQRGECEVVGRRGWIGDAARSRSIE